MARMYATVKTLKDVCFLEKMFENTRYTRDVPTYYTLRTERSVLTMFNNPEKHIIAISIGDVALLDHAKDVDSYYGEMHYNDIEDEEVARWFIDSMEDVYTNHNRLFLIDTTFQMDMMNKGLTQHQNEVWKGAMKVVKKGAYKKELDKFAKYIDKTSFKNKYPRTFEIFLDQHSPLLKEAFKEFMESDECVVKGIYGKESNKVAFECGKLFGKYLINRA